MSNFSKIIEYLSTHSDKGKAFEHCCKWFLENDPVYSKSLKNVWLWKDWTHSWGRDKGIDLIAEDYSGKIWAIQAKAYDEKYSITKADIDTFLSESSREKINFRLLIATTNLIGDNAQEVMDGQEKRVSKCLLDSLEESSVDWSLFLDGSNKNNKEDKKVISPYPHQEKALKNIEIGFTQSSYGQLHMACGTGKTLVGLWLAERIKSNATLVLVPSLSLVKQLCDEWSRHSSQDFNFFPIYVCSDGTVSKKSGDYDNDKFISNVADLGYPVTTNPQDVVDEFGSTSRPKVIFCTYQSSNVIAQACEIDSSLNFDLVIADEAHRCAGKVNSEFATIVKKDAIRAKRRLFMTATPKIFTDHVKMKTKELDYEIVSMDDSEKFGPVFHKLSFSDAIKDNLLVNYQVIISVMDNKQYQEYIEKGRLVAIDNLETDARTLASQLIVAKAIKANNLTRIISFHSRKKSAQEFIDTLPQAISLLSDNEKPEISFKWMIHGEMTQEKRSNILRPFKKQTQGDIALLANVKCLSEGVDIPELDGIAFIDPKGSVIDIVQAIGRVIRKPKNKIQDQDSLDNAYKRPEKVIGTIIIPVFVDGVADEELALEKSCFRDVWRVIKALRAHDDVLAEELDNISLELGKKTSRSLSKFSKICVDIPISIGGAKFVEELNLKIVENCSRLSLAKEYPELAAQWHSTKNGVLTPNDVTSGSSLKVWWKCLIGDDHEWITAISDRKRGGGCLVCSNRVAVPSNCLVVTNPEIAAQWHSTKNGNLTPNNITSGSAKKVWWKCSNGEDHEWQSKVSDRKRGGGCLVCSNRVAVPSNCIVTTNPDLAREWHPTKNGCLIPNNFVAGSGHKVWWKCQKVGAHEWQAVIGSRAVGAGCPFCAGKKVDLYNCLATTNPNLAKEWHYSKNKDLMPNKVVAGSNKKVWWQCPKGEDHEWQAVISSRVSGSSCPVCSNNVVVSSNCLVATNPDLAREWHVIKNGTLTPNDVTSGSGQKVWWKCEKGEDHEWEAVIAKRRGCPVCSNKVVKFSNCLANLNQFLAKEWHQIRNNKLTPKDVVAGSTKKVWWKCSKDEAHEWEARIETRNRGVGCPFCAGKRVVLSNCLATTNQALAKEWHPTKNGNLRPKDVTSGANKKVWWKCSKVETHEWQSVIGNRTSGNGCPFCKGKVVVHSNCLATTNPNLAREWHKIKNGVLTPNDVTSRSNKKVWWKCLKEESHEWQSIIGNRFKGYGCPFCSGRLVVPSKSLAIINPDLAKEWHKIKNGDLTPKDFSFGSNKKVWWQCPKKHEWIAEIRQRAQKKVGCPECKKIKNNS